MAAKILLRDGDKKVLEHVTEAERLAGATQKAEAVEAAQGRANALRAANEAADRIKANAAASGPSKLPK